MNSPGHSPRWVGATLRWIVLGTLIAAPLAFGSVHPAAYLPLLVIASSAGLVSWAKGHWERALGGPLARVPAIKILLALHALVVLQLVPLPPRMLAIVSPGSFAYYEFVSLGPFTAWRPISVSPPDTARGFAFLAAMSLLYGAVFREFREARWRRRLTVAIVATALFMTLVALAQASSSDPHLIYGIWRPKWDWGVFGPYVSKNHFAGYVVMAIPLAMAWAGSGMRELRSAWHRRRIGWLALGDREGGAVIRRLAVVIVLVVGVIASRSRGGVMAFVLSSATAPLLVHRRRWALFAIAALSAAAVYFLGGDELARNAQRGLNDSRFAVWKDARRMVPDFPVFGSGMNTFGTSYPRYQSVWRSVWFGEAHNEYLQALFDLGPAGALVVLALLVRLLRTAARHATASTIGLGLLGGLLAAAFHNMVEFNWQIPANAATFAALAGLAMQDPPANAPRLDRSESHA